MEPMTDRTARETVAVLIPAYQPDEKLLATAESCLRAGVRRLLVVDDGSDARCAPVFSALEKLGVTVTHHEKNRGKGAALKTGIRAVRETWPDATGVVTADADGQHATEDICALMDELAQQPDGILLGTRDFSGDDVPFNSRHGNRITSAIFRLITGIRCPDTQTGLRAIPAALFDFALGVEGERYEYEMNFLLDAAERRYPLRFHPIRTIYLDGNQTSHFRVVHDSYLVYRRPITFLGVALASLLIDLVAFKLFDAFVFPGLSAHIMAATAAARILSGAANFFLNKHVTFRSKGRTGSESLRYLVLFLAVMFLSGRGVTLLSRLLPTMLAKILVDGVLFVVNYFVERKWVFREAR